MIFIFDKNGKYVDQARTVNEAADISGVVSGNISHILNNQYLTSQGFYFVKYTHKLNEHGKQQYIDDIEKGLSLIIICGKKQPLLDKIDALMVAIK